MSKPRNYGVRRRGEECRCEEDLTCGYCLRTFTGGWLPPVARTVGEQVKDEGDRMRAEGKVR